MNHIYRLVWCRSRRALVVVSELASSKQGGCVSVGQSARSRRRALQRQLLAMAVLGTAGLLFASGALAQSTGDAKLDDLQSLMAKYSPSAPTASPRATVDATDALPAAPIAANASPLVAAGHSSAARSVTTRLPATIVAARVAPTVVETLSPIAAATSSIPVFAPDTAAATSLTAADHTAVALAPPTQGNLKISTVPVVDVADRRTALAAGTQVALQSSSIQVADAPVPPIGDSLLALPAIKPTMLPIAARPIAVSAATSPTTSNLVTAGVISVVAPTSGVATAAQITLVPNVIAPASAAADIFARSAVNPNTAAVNAAAAIGVAVPQAVSASTTPSAPAATVAADALAEVAAVGTTPTAVGATSAVADRRLNYVASAASVAATQTNALTPSSGSPEAAAAGQSSTALSPAVAPASFAAVSSFATASTPLALNASGNANAAVAPLAVPVFPTPGAQPTGLIVGNGGVVGTTTQLLGPTSNSLFAGGNGYVTNGSLMVNNANFSQGYTVVSTLGIPVLSLNPVGTVLTSTSGAVVGGTGVNSHLTLLGGVTSNNYIQGINNGGPDGLLGVALPTAAPAYAATCLGALAVSIACYGVNAAQDYQVLVGDGATANGSKEVVIGTNASHTLPAVSADVAFPGAGRNDPNNPTGVPTADYEARLGHSVVVGDNATGTANAQTIVGAEANASAANSVALGFQSAANRGGAIGYAAFGLTAPQTSVGEVSIGSPNAERQITNVAAGSAGTDAVNVLQLQSVVTAAAGDSVQYDDAGHGIVTLSSTPASTDGGITGGTTVTNLHQGALTPTSTDAVNGSQLFATNSTINNVINTSSKYYQANSVGVGSVALGIDSLAAGPTAVATGNGSIAEGSGATTLGLNAVALGTGANATAFNSVALGAGSLALRGPQLLYPGFGLLLPQTSVGEVSVGAAGAARQITNVAAGQFGTDAVNVNQLAGVSAVAANSVQYDAAVAQDARVTLAGPASVDGGVTNGTTITNLHQGALNATSTDAVNGSQLFATNSTINNVVNTSSKYYQANSTGTGSVAQGANSLAAGPSAVATGNSSIADGNGAVTSGVNSVALGTNASSSALNSLALGTNASVMSPNSVALGAGSLSMRGAQANYAVIGQTALQNSVGEVSLGGVGAERQLTSVAAGSAGTDAVNVNQLAGVSAVAANSVQYDGAVAQDARVTLAGPASINGGVTNGTTITNLHQGALTATSTDAVNGSQLFATNNSISTVVNTSSKYYQANSTGIGSLALGTDSLAAGPSAVATGNGSIAEGNGAATSGINSIALGTNASSSASNSVALGTNASSIALNSVALGAGSLSMRGAQANYPVIGQAGLQNSVGEVSLGGVGGERQLTNVAAGSAGTDAVNVNQLAGVSATASNAVQYDTGVPLKASVTLAGPLSTDGGVSNGTTVTNLHQGALNATSTDAVNGSQLFATNNTVSNLFTTGSKYYQANSINPGSSAVGTDSLAAGPQSVSTGAASIAMGNHASSGSQNAVAIGTGANASFANSVALGSGSATTVGALSNYTAIGLAAPQTSLGEVNVGTRQITGVSAGQAGSDAVNVNQLAGVSSIASNAVQYDTGVPQKTSVTLAGPVSTDGGITNGTTVTNLHQGALNAASTDAVDGSQLFATNSTINNVVNTTSKYYQANSTSPGSSAVGADSLAAGPQSVSTGAASIAMGSHATSGSQNAVAIGTGANASFANSVALGSGSTTTVGAQANYAAYGLTPLQTSVGEVSVGAAGGDRQITNVAAGQAATDAVNVAQLQGVSASAANAVQYDATVPTKASVTLAGAVSTDGGTTNGTTITNLHQGALNATSTDAVNGSQLFATNNTVSNIVNTTSKYYQANSNGAGSLALGTDSLASGPQAVATGDGSIAEGNGATTQGVNSVAIGTGASVIPGNSVALGSASLVQRGALANYAAYGLTPLQNSVGEVSVGATGAERQITNVAAGQAATDAVNVAQLQGVSVDAANAVQYDTTVPARANITLAGAASTDGGVTGGTLITNLHRGTVTPASTDAINGAQLYGWTLDPTNPYSNTSLYNDFTNTPANKYLSVSSASAGASSSGVDSVALGPMATATADNGLALGTGANANMANSIALGAGSTTSVGARINYIGYGLAAPQTSAGELNVGNRQITGVAAASTPDGAVNLAQLQAVVGTTNNAATPASKLAVQYTPDAAGNPTNAVALTGDGSGTPVAITNVAAGAETPTSTAAVNGSQVWHWSQDTANRYSNTSLYNDISTLSAGNGNNKYVQVNSTLGAATASGTDSVAVGPAASASGANSVAVGNGAQATSANSVALGSGSVASRDNTVSVGNVGTERQVTNVAAGTANTDAANVGQVNAGVQQAQNWAAGYTDQKFGALNSEVQQIGNRANAGVAAAMAMAGLPQAYEPGKSMAAVAAGTFRSESSIAVGVSTISEGGRWVYKMTGSMDSRGDGGVSVGAGMQW